MAIGDDNTLTDPSAFFREPASPRQRQYEALRAYFVDDVPSADAARQFGYTPGAFRVLCHKFRHDSAARDFFLQTGAGRPPGVRREDPTHDLIVSLRKQNHSIFEISDALDERDIKLSPAAVGRLLRDDGFAPLPRRLDDERPERVGPAIQPVADVRAFDLQDGEFTTACGGLFLFVPDLVRYGVPKLASSAGLPGSKSIPAENALLAALATKLWSIERKSHIMPLVADPGLALFCGLNVIPKKSYLSEYSHRISRPHTLRLLGTWNDAFAGSGMVAGRSLNLDFHSIPFSGEHPTVQKHFVAMRSRRQPSILAFLAQDADSNLFCYSNADLRKGEEAEEVFRFLDFWKKHHDGGLPGEIVFDSKLTTHAGLVRLDKMGVPFMTLRRRDKRLLAEARALPASAWRVIELENVSRKFRTPRVFDQTVQINGHSFRQLFIEDLGHDEPTVLLTNHRSLSAKRIIGRYAQRMLIENALSDAVRFFHLNALSSSVAMKVDFDIALLVIASGLYRQLADRMRGYEDAQARQIFRDLVDMPATVKITGKDVCVTFHRRAHLPIVMAADVFNKAVTVPWLRGARLSFRAAPA